MRFVWLCALVALGALAQVRAEVVVPRLSPLPVKVGTERVPLSGTWTFNGGDPIEVPGEWVMQGFEVEKGREAVYERTFDVPRSWRRRRVKLRCNGIYSRARVEVNGKAVGSHLGGFTAFELDVTDAAAGLVDPYRIKSGFLKNRDSYSFTMIYVTYDLFPRCANCNKLED